MEEEAGDLLPEQDDLDIRARLTPQDHSEFRIGRDIRPDSSLFLFIKKRPPRDFEGFVDATTMTHMTSLQNRGIRVLNRVVNPPVQEKHSSVLKSSEEQLKYLNHNKYGRPATQLLLTETLPRHDYERNLCAIADCLSADSPAVRRNAATRLERLMVVSNYKNIPACKTHLLAVALRTHLVVNDTDNGVSGVSGVRGTDATEDQDHVKLCGHLHLLTLSALLSKAQHCPSVEECRQFTIKPKVNRKQTGDDVRQEVMKTVHAFLEHLDQYRKEGNAKSIGLVTLAQDKKKFCKAHLYEQLSSLFLILNEIAVEEWTDKGFELLTHLKDVSEVMAKEIKRIKPEARVGLDTLLIRSLVLILNTSFAKVRQQVGEEELAHPQVALTIVRSLVERLSLEQVHDFLPCLSTLAFHENRQVRRETTHLLQQVHYPALKCVVNHLQAVLALADFHLHHLPLAEKCGEENVCKWYTLKGRFGSKPADCHVMVHCLQCQTSDTESVVLGNQQCVLGEGADSQECQQHGNNIQTLVKLSPHHHLLQLMAFQLSPFMFYATETVKGERLLEHLINHRSGQRWLHTRSMSRVMHDVISGLEYLASRHTASRDVTAYDTLVVGPRRRGGATGEMMDVLDTDDFTVKLANLTLAHQFRPDDYDDGDDHHKYHHNRGSVSGRAGTKQSVIPVAEQGPIPLLWTPPEALLRGEYCEQSMVYSAGCVMYEVWTHGCQPFTTYQKDTADTVRMILLNPDSVPLIRWPCIPDDVFDIMTRCTSAKPTARPSLPALKQTFLEIHTKIGNDARVRHLQMDGLQTSYPSFSDDQMKRKHLPERGIPPDVLEVIADINKNRSDSYRNTTRPCKEDYPSMHPVHPDTVGREFSSPYWVQIAHFKDFTSVREMVPRKFVQNELPLLEAHAAHERIPLNGLTDWLKDRDNQPRLEDMSRDHIVHERRYRPSWSFLDTACKGLLISSASGYVSMGVERYLHVLLSLTRAVHHLHSAGWLHRQLRANTVLVDCSTGQATLARLNGVCRLKSPTEMVMADSWRWQAPEVLSNHLYTKQSDVFMLGTVFWEVFFAREVTECNPVSTENDFLPFAYTSRESVLSLVCKNEPLVQPRGCPDWLYLLSLKCRHPKPSHRPRTEDIMEILQNKLTHAIDPDRKFLPHPKRLSNAIDPNSEDGSAVPALPERFQTKQFSPSTDETTDRGNHVYRKPVTNVWSIDLQIPSSAERSRPPLERGIAQDKTDYLTPLNEEIMSAEQSLTVASGDLERGIAQDKTDYLTPLSEEIMSVHQSLTVASGDLERGIAQDKTDYLTPLSEEIMSVQRSLTVASGDYACPLSDDDDSSLYPAGPTLDKLELPPMLGLIVNKKNAQELPPIPGGQVQRRIPGLETGSSRPQNISRRKMARTGPLPPLPSDQPQNSVYNEIKDT